MGVAGGALNSLVGQEVGEGAVPLEPVQGSRVVWAS
jgi:hypothetical protein